MTRRTNVSALLLIAFGTTKSPEEARNAFVIAWGTLTDAVKTDKLEELRSQIHGSALPLDGVTPLVNAASYVLAMSMALSESTDDWKAILLSAFGILDETIARA